MSGLAYSGCTPSQSPSPPGPNEAASRTAPAAAKAGWEREWESTLGQARKEGEVAIYGNWSPAVRRALTEAVKNKFGINVEFTPFSRGSDMAVRAQREATAGLLTVDAFGIGAPPGAPALTNTASGWRWLFKP